MYSVDHQDTVKKLDSLPQSSVGAPIPILYQTEHVTTLAYYAEIDDPDWDGESVRLVGNYSEDEHVALVRFTSYATMFGPPNDEAFHGHPLASRGLNPYGFFEIESSSWIRQLENMNSVHPDHRAQEFINRYRHFVLSFHDTTFECVARDYELLFSGRGSVAGVLAEFIASLAPE